MRAFRPESRRSSCRFDITAGPPECPGGTALSERTPSSAFVYAEGFSWNRLPILILVCLLAGCGRFKSDAANSAGAQRIVCIGQAYNEMIYALDAQANLVGVDYSSTYPPEIKKLPTVGYHRALSAEGILLCIPP